MIVLMDRATKAELIMSHGEETKRKRFEQSWINKRNILPCSDRECGCVFSREMKLI